MAQQQLQPAFDGGRRAPSAVRVGDASDRSGPCRHNQERPIVGGGAAGCAHRTQLPVLPAYSDEFRHRLRSKPATGSDRLAPPTMHEWDRTPWATRVPRRRCIRTADVALIESGATNQRQQRVTERAVAWRLPMARSGRGRVRTASTRLHGPAQARVALRILSGAPRAPFEHPVRSVARYAARS
jgi:hypothetical protein